MPDLGAGMIGVDLFTGCGGALLGAHRAGVHHVQAVEWSAAEVETLRTATGDGGLFSRPHPSWGKPSPGLVRAGDVRDWEPVPADLWWASPPCQPWSSAGERLGARDPRNGWPWVLQLLDRGPRPRWLVAENVPGLLHHTEGHRACPGCYLRGIVRRLRVRFASVQVWLLNAADFGVPQTRRRVFLVGGPRELEEPAPTHAEQSTGDLLPWVSMAAALGLDVPVVVGGTRPHGPGEPRRLRELGTEEPAPTITGHDGSGGPFVVDRPPWWHRASDPAGPSRAIGSKGNAAVLLRPSPCVTATEVKGAAMAADGHRTAGGGLQRASDALQLGTGRRRLTVEECLVLQGLPADWPLAGTGVDKYRQAGNAVPPPLAQAVVSRIVEAQ